MTSTERAERNTKANQLANLVQKGLILLQKETGESYQKTIDDMEDVIQWTDNAPMVRTVRRAV